MDEIEDAPLPQELTLKTAATLIACGLDPAKSKIFV
jgi:tryptophanyl-tRNA synthetase